MKTSVPQGEKEEKNRALYDKTENRRVQKDERKKDGIWRQEV